MQSTVILIKIKGNCNISEATFERVNGIFKDPKALLGLGCRLKQTVMSKNKAPVANDRN